jgi:putative DNA primase/helicase
MNLQKSPDFDAIRAFMKVIGKPTGTARLRGFFPAGHPAKGNDAGRKAPPSRSVVEQWQSEGRGVYVVINDGGDTDADITACRAFFCEWDDRPKEWQLTAWRDLGLPQPTMQVDTGGKSIHNYWVLESPISPQHWRIIQKRLLEHADADRALKNPSRVMRLPGTYHVCADGTLGNQASIVQLTEQLYTVEQIESCLPEPEPPPLAPTFAPLAASDAIALHELLPRDLQQLVETGTGEGSRNHDCFRVAAVALAIDEAARAAGLTVSGTPEQVVLDFASRCSPALPQQEALTCYGSAAEQSRVADKGWPERLRYHLNRQAREQRRQQPAKPAPAPDPEQPQTVEVTEALQLFLDSKNADYLPLVELAVFGLPQTRWICTDDTLHRWNGTHYEPVPDEQLTPLLAYFLQQLHTTERKDGEPIHPWGRPRYIAEALAWMRAKLGTTEVNPNNAINCQNGVISWTWDGSKFQLQFGPHHPDQAFTYVTSYAFNPDADPAHMIRLLEAVEPHDRDTLQRILGSGLDLAKYRAVRGRPRALLMIGSGSNGKDTIRTALRDTLGARNFSSCTLADFRQYDQGRKFPIAPLRDASINWSSENSQFVHIDSLQALKGAISGEELAWEVKGIQEANFVPNCLFVFNLNKEPSLTGEQAAIETRFHVFQFTRTYVSHPKKAGQLQADPRLKDDPAFIRRHICPAFLNWLLEGLQLSIEQGIDYDTGIEAMRQVRRKGSHLWDFCDEIGLEWQHDAKTPLLTVWSRLCDWYESEGFKDGHGRWVIDTPNDPPVKASRLLVQRLSHVFPELKVEKDTKARSAQLVGVRLPPTFG